jgi:hypothetical protein
MLAPVFAMGGVRSRRATLSITVFVGALSLAAASADAYRPPARALVQRAMEKQLARDTKTLRVEAETQAFDISGMPRGAPMTEKWLVMGPSTMRRDVETAGGARAEIRVDERLTVRAPGAADKTTKAVADPFFDALAAAPPFDDTRAAERLLKDAKAYGVNTEVVSLARWDGRVAWLIGSKPWETDKPQLWLDKDLLTVARVVKVQKKADGSTQKIDERYLGWGSPVGGNWFPASVEVWVDDKLVQRTLVRNVERNVSFDATLFK